MTAAHFSAARSAARRLRVVTEEEAETPLVGYLVLVPEGTDPTELFTADGTRVRFRPLQPAEVSAEPRQSEARQPEDRGQPEDRQRETRRPEPRQPETRGLHVDAERHTAHADGRRLDLTYLEFELLAHLVGNPRRVHTRDHLVTTLWGYSHIGDGRTVDVHVARLRRKLGRYRETIVTVRRVGYKYEPAQAG